MLWNENTISWVFLEKMVLEEDIKEIFEFIHLEGFYLAKRLEKTSFLRFYKLFLVHIINI